MDNQQSRHILLYLLFVFQVCLFNSFLSEIFSVRCGGCVGINKHFSRPDCEDGKTELQSAAELILGHQVVQQLGEDCAKEISSLSVPGELGPFPAFLLAIFSIEI